MHAHALLAAGPEFLTRAFRKFGLLSEDNRVARIAGSRPCPGGSTGHKLFLTLEYARAEEGLETELFAKFSRDPEDPIRDMGRREMESEVRLATLAQHPRFPISVPTTFFADYHGASGSGLLITSRIGFGAGGIEPQLEKCADHHLSDPLPYYRSVLGALAQLAAAHKSGALESEVERSFPFDARAAAAADPIPWSEDELRALVAGYGGFAARCPQLLPAPLRDPEFIVRFEEEALAVLRRDAAIRRFLHRDPDYIALCHWNAQLDNAWFWRGDDGEPRCGLIDWGRVRQMNVAYALWGCLVGAEAWVWERHLDELLALFIANLHAHGGPLLKLPELRLHLQLYAATIGIAGIMIAPERILLRLPEAAAASGPRDPVFARSEEARGFLHILTIFLTFWHSGDVNAALARATGATGSIGDSRAGQCERRKPR